MFNEDIKEKFYSHYKICGCVPLIYQVECLNALEKIIKELKEENPYASISELFNE